MTVASLRGVASDLALLGLLTVLAAILTAAMVLQYGYGEMPCPLCLLQRVAMFCICFGAMMAFRQDDRTRGVGIGLLSSLFLLAVSARQTLIDVCPLPGRDYVGSAVLGLHMPVWSVIVASASATAFALHLTVLGDAQPEDVRPRRPLAATAGVVGLYVIALCVVNLVSVVLQCGFGVCSTSGYKML